MSYIYTLLAIVCACVIAEATGLITHDSAAFILVTGAGVLLLHRVVVFVRELADVDGEPFPDLHADFIKAYFDACRSGIARDWQIAAAAAKRWENALSKPHRHTRLRGYRGSQS